MIEKLLENWLDNASERSYQAVFVQMLSAQGYKVVHSTRHTALEYGKDVLAIDPYGNGCAFQLKGNPGAKLGLAQFRDEVQPQLLQLVSQAVVFPGFPDGPHKSFLVTNGFFDEEVQRAVDDINRMPYLSKIALICRGDLLAWCKEYEYSLWPSELNDTRLLLELFLSDPKDSLPKDKLSILIAKILILENDNAQLRSEREFYRATTSAALLTGIAISYFAEAENHYAVVLAWTLLAVSIIAAGEKHGFELKDAALESLRLAEEAIMDQLSLLWQETQNNSNLIEGNPLTDSQVLGWRHTVLLGLLSCLALYDQNQACLSESSRTGLRDWLLRFKKKVHLWGEGAVASLVPWLVWLRKNDSTSRPDHEIAGLTEFVIVMNQHKGSSPLVNPYYAYEDIARRSLQLPSGPEGRMIEEESFSGGSYVAEPLLHLLVRTNFKQKCKSLWPDFTRLVHHVCLPENAWQYCILEIFSGSNQTRIYPFTYKWTDLKADVLRVGKTYIPSELCSRPFLLALWWQVANYRYTTASSKAFVEHAFPGWGEW